MMIAPASLALPVRQAWPRPLVLAGWAVRHLVDATALLTLLASAYTWKRRLGINVVPGIDMLPDERIEAALHLVSGLFGL